MRTTRYLAVISPECKNILTPWIAWRQLLVASRTELYTQSTVDDGECVALSSRFEMVLSNKKARNEVSELLWNHSRTTFVVSELNNVSFCMPHHLNFFAVSFSVSLLQTILFTEWSHLETYVFYFQWGLSATATSRKGKGRLAFVICLSFLFD